MAKRTPKKPLKGKVKANAKVKQKVKIKAKIVFGGEAAMGKKGKFYITTAIDYPNSKPHLRPRL